MFLIKNSFYPDSSITSQNVASVEILRVSSQRSSVLEADEFEVIETEQLSMKTHLADSFIRVTTGSEQAIVHCEFQTQRQVRDVPMPFRMAGYIGSAIEFYKLPIYSHVVYSTSKRLDVPTQDCTSKRCRDIILASNIAC